MKRYFPFLIGLVVLVLSVQTPAYAQVEITVPLTEANPIFNFPDAPLPPPFPNPFLPVPGFLYLCEEGTTCGKDSDISDIVVFGQAAGVPYARACLRESDDEAPTDCGAIPGGGPQLQFANIVETRAADGSETMLYRPSPGGPGYLVLAGTPFVVQYLITSDTAGESDSTNPTPEPASFILLAVGIAFMAVWFRGKVL
jgi:hypothetical protein